jgi:uncharacterized membrane protein
MILALKIAVGIVLAVVFINVGFWACILLVYLVVTLFEAIGKWLR